MGRRPQPEIKQRLLDACIDYALEHAFGALLRARRGFQGFLGTLTKAG